MTFPYNGWCTENPQRTHRTDLSAEDEALSIGIQLLRFSSCDSPLHTGSQTLGAMKWELVNHFSNNINNIIQYHPISNQYPILHSWHLLMFADVGRC